MRSGGRRLVRFVGAVAPLALLASGAASAEPAREPLVSFSFADPRIDESSGLVSLGATVLTINDSGDGPFLYDVDASTGRTVGVTTYTGDDVVDVEALATGPDGTVWVGDIGDNRSNRMSVSVYAVPPVTPGERTVSARRYDLQYPGGPRDAETLLVSPRTGRLYVVSKGLFSGQVFAAPRRLAAGRPNLLRPVARTGGTVTDGSFTPDGRYVVLRTYSTATLYDSQTWRSPAAMALPRQRQGEGLAMLSSGERMLLSSEGVRSPVLSVPLSPAMVRAMRSPGSAPPRPGPDPSETVLDRFTGRDGLLRTITAAAVVMGALAVTWVLFRGARPRSRWRR